jgi:hypothetical protein
MEDILIKVFMYYDTDLILKEGIKHVQLRAFSLRPKP